jgi:hypothetical protein
MKILARLPIDEEPALIEVRGEVYQVWRNQAIVWVSLDEALAPFPAILDTGHSHNLSMPDATSSDGGRATSGRSARRRSPAISCRVIPRSSSSIGTSRDGASSPGRTA